MARSVLSYRGCRRVIDSARSARVFSQHRCPNHSSSPEDVRPPPPALKRILLGKPIPSHLAHHERLSRLTGLAVLSSDALSSVAYATDFIIVTLIVAGTQAIGYVLPISFVIASLLAIVAFSYRQTIYAYPQGRRRVHRREGEPRTQLRSRCRGVAARRLHADRFGQHFRRRARHHVGVSRAWMRTASSCACRFSRS